MTDLTETLALWRGRSDPSEGHGGRRWHEIIQPLRATSQKGVAFTGFACDAGVVRNQGRPGAHKGPQALRCQLANLPVLACEALFETGDIAPQTRNDHDGLERAQDELATHLAQLLAQGLSPISLGGGHEIALASFEGLAQFLAESQTTHTPRIGIINLDAHFDLRHDSRPSSGTPFRQIAENCHQRGWPFHYYCLGISRFSNTPALFERAKTLGVHWCLDEELARAPIASTLAQVQAFIDAVDHIYFTVCLDVLPAAVAPGVSAPAARGVDLAIVETLVDSVSRSQKLRLADIAELNPNYDIDQRTARVAARLVAKIVDAWWPNTPV